MASQRARYDGFARPYVEFADTWGDTQPHALLPEELAGQRVLDLACGHGRFSRYLAERGARVVGLDLSANLIAAARDRSTKGEAIHYLVGDAASTTWWDGEPFDGVLCHMALMDIDDLAGAARTVATVLRPGGWFSFSVLHPCNPGAWEGRPDAQPSWPPDRGYDAEGWWTTGADGIRGNVGSNHRMLSTYLNVLLCAGFGFDEFGGTAMPGPMYFIARCRRL